MENTKTKIRIKNNFKEAVFNKEIEEIALDNKLFSDKFMLPIQLEKNYNRKFEEEQNPDMNYAYWPMKIEAKLGDIVYMWDNEEKRIKQAMVVGINCKYCDSRIPNDFSCNYDNEKPANFEIKNGYVKDAEYAAKRTLEHYKERLGSYKGFQDLRWKITYTITDGKFFYEVHHINKYSEYHKIQLPWIIEDNVYATYEDLQKVLFGLLFPENTVQTLEKSNKEAEDNGQWVNDVQDYEERTLGADDESFYYQ